MANNPSADTSRIDRTTLDECIDAAGSLNNPNGTGLPTVVGPYPGTTTPGNPYVPPAFCEGTFRLTQDACAPVENLYQDSIAAEQLNISGAPLNVFKLLGNHEQGKLINVVGDGESLGTNDTSMAFDDLDSEWASNQTGLAVLQDPAYIGYDFGIRKTSFGQPENAPGQPAAQHITSFRIKQGPDALTRALQVRVERSDGNFFQNPDKITTSFVAGSGKGSVVKFRQGVASRPGAFMLFATAPTRFQVAFTSPTGTAFLGEAIVGQQFDSQEGSFTVLPGPVQYEINDSFMVPVEMEWKRVDVVNLPNLPSPALIRIKQSAASRYWRLVPTSFAGAADNHHWVVEKLELFDYQATTLDDIQDSLFMENRDRDYAKASIQLRVQYTPFDAVSDLSRFGFQMADIYSFTVSFANMVRALGRPIVIGDVLELPSEVQYDHNLRPVRKFLEVTDTGWAADGFTTGWQPIIFRFQAQQLVPGQEHRDLFGTVDTQKYIVDDKHFFEGIEHIETQPLTVMERNESEARAAVPEKGTNVREQASGTNRFNQPGSYDGVGLYVEDGLPPDGQPYETGYNKLPDVAGIADGAFFRLEYPPELNLAARLYKFSQKKNKWIYIETDRRNQRSSHTPSQRTILDMGTRMSPTTKKI